MSHVCVVPGRHLLSTAFTVAQVSAVASPPVVSAEAAAPTASRPRLAGELLVVAALVLCYDRVRDLAQSRPALAIDDGRSLLHAERSLHVAVELGTNQWLATHQLLAFVSSWYYQLAHLSVTLAVLLYCYVKHPALYRPARNALVMINALALCVFWVYPVAPPRLLPAAGFVDIAVQTGAADASNTAAPNPYAAMPSLHTSWAVWVVVIGVWVARASWTRVLLVLHGLLTVVIIVATGNHYLLDLAGGAAVAFLAVFLAGLLHRREGPQKLDPLTAGRI